MADKMIYTATFLNKIKEHKSIVSQLIEACQNDFYELVEMCIASLISQHKILIFGNGGSASQAEHIAAELIGKFYRERMPIPAISLCSNLSIITAISNDISFNYVFSRQLEAYAEEHDVAIGLSTSGNSLNIIEAMKEAKDRNLHTAALTGKDGGNLKNIVDVCIKVPSDDTARIQEIHILLGHILCEIIESVLT